MGDYVNACVLNCNIVCYKQILCENLIWTMLNCIFFSQTNIFYESSLKCLWFQYRNTCWNQRKVDNITGFVKNLTKKWHHRKLILSTFLQDVFVYIQKRNISLDWLLDTELKLLMIQWSFIKIEKYLSWSPCINHNQLLLIHIYIIIE